MSAKFQFRPDLTPVVTELREDLALLIGENTTEILEQPGAAELARRLCEGKDPAPEHEPLLAQWVDKNFLIANEPLSRSEAAVWTSAGLASVPAGSPSLELLAFETSGAEILSQSLKSAGFQIEQNGMLVACLDDYLSQNAREVHAGCRKQQRPWAPVKLTGHTIWFGPVFFHGPDQACWACLAHRLRQNRWPQCLLWGHEADSHPPQFSVAQLSTTLAIGAGFIAHVLGAWARRSQRFRLTKHIYTLDTRSLELREHFVARVPDCPDCGVRKSLPAPRGIEEFRKFVSPLVGLVPEVELSGREGGLFHARASVIQPLPIGKARPLMRPNLSIGKGLTAESAEIGCIAEAAERHSLVFRGDESLIPAPIAANDGVKRVDIQKLLQFSPQQYSQRERWAHLDDPRRWIPRPFADYQQIDWAPVTSLVDGEVHYAPAAYCYLGFPRTEICRPDTNGCAAGQSREAAVLDGLLELIERDAAAIWWYNRLRRPAVPIREFREPEAWMVAREFERMGRRVHLLDLTTDIGIPVYAAVTVTGQGGEPLFGLGCSTDPSRAAFRALAEMCQVWYWISRRKEIDPLWRDWLKQASPETTGYLEPTGETSVPGAIPESDALDHCLRRLTALNLEPMALDLTRPDVGVPVVRMIVPGLRHFWPRFAPGRLFDVPVAMAWLSEPVAEDCLNPFPCML